MSRSVSDDPMDSSMESVMRDVTEATSDGATRLSYAEFSWENAESMACAPSTSPRISSSMADALQTNAEPSWNSGMLVMVLFSTASPYSATEVSKRPRMRASFVSVF